MPMRSTRTTRTKRAVDGSISPPVSPALPTVAKAWTTTNRPLSRSGFAIGSDTVHAVADMESVGSSARKGVAPLVAKMSRLADELAGDTRLVNEVVTRPHPLLVAVTRDELMVVVAPAAVWDKGREILK